MIEQLLKDRFERAFGNALLTTSRPATAVGVNNGRVWCTGICLLVGRVVEVQCQLPLAYLLVD